MSLTCAALLAALMAAAPGAELTVKPGQRCDAVAIQGVRKARPVQVWLAGVTMRDLRIRDSAGLEFIGGRFEAVDGLQAQGARAYAVHVRGSSDLTFRGGVYTAAGRGLVINTSRRVLVKDNRFAGIRADGINVVSSHDVQVRSNTFEGFRPNPTRCRLAGKPGTAASAGQTVIGLSRRECEARGGTWTDGDHPDAVQIFGALSTDILVSQNSAVGAMQCYGQFKRATDRGQRIRIVGNYCETSARWAVLIEDCTDCEATGNVGRRWQGTPNKVQMQAINSTGKFCGNTNPDAPRDNPLVQPCDSETLRDKAR